uniref:Uncharacterized protein n=1 Tax=Micrurus paraensis TaxID=1970185 RepID=A0A2D4JYA1_9SAUR
MECFLKANDLWDIINSQMPLAAADQKQHDKAMTYIILSLEDEQFINVAANEVWLKLRSVHVSVSACNIVQLSRKLYRASLQPGESVEQHVVNIQTLFVELEQCGMQIPESQKVLLVLNSLDVTWDIVSAVFECKPE